MPRTRTIATMLRDNGLTLVLMLLFLGTWAGQAATGWREHNHELADLGQAELGLGAYLVSGHFLEATGENWESEFLQMGVFVMLTAVLVQRGSPESNDPDEPDPVAPVTARSPWPVLRGGLWLALYRRSLAIAFLALFVVSFAMHAVGGTIVADEEHRARGQPEEGLRGYLVSSRLWFESLQNWQSEFLSLAAMVYLSVYLRYAGSAESKPVATPHDAHGD